MIEILLNILFFFIGFVLGYIIKGVFELKKFSTNKILMVVITCVWIVTIIAEIIIPTYSTPLYVHIFMGAVIGTYFDIKKIIK